MIFLLAGHNLRVDPGAIGVNGRKEARETVILRNKIAFELTQLQAKFAIDNDSDDLATTLRKVTSGSGSVVIDIHFNAGPVSATGAEVLVGIDADKGDMDFANEILNTTVSSIGIRSRGVKSEKDTPHKRLGVMREHGRVCLLEVCFITNHSDMKLYDTNSDLLAKNIAAILVKYDALA